MNSPDLYAQHTRQAIAERLGGATRHSYLGDFVLGAVDGGVTTFAIVAGASGAGLSNGVVVVMGLANVLADGLSMAASNFLRARSDQQLLDKSRQIENHHIQQVPEGEREEIRQIFAAKGFDGEVLERIVETITADRELWVNTMLAEEWNLSLYPASPWRSGLATFSAFLLAGLIPLLPSLVALGGEAERTFLYSSLLTAATFFGVGFARGKIVNESPWSNAIETLSIGGAAATVAYFVGAALERLA
jgi:VIT1/CCC1 family predicted Fe2+/Mn2+ transporter